MCKHSGAGPQHIQFLDRMPQCGEDVVSVTMMNRQQGLRLTCAFPTGHEALTLILSEFLCTTMKLEKVTYVQHSEMFAEPGEEAGTEHEEYMATMQVREGSGWPPIGGGACMAPAGRAKESSRDVRNTPIEPVWRGAYTGACAESALQLHATCTTRCV